MIEKYLTDLAKKGTENNIPIVSIEVAQLLRFLVGLTKSRRILEIGTAIGYSTSWLALGMEEGKITTVEIQAQRQKEAQDNLAVLGLDSKVEFILGDAKEILPTLAEGYDFIFLDSSKGQYINLLEECLRLLNPGGLLVTDNVFFRGMVEGKTEVNPRFKTLVRRLKEYLQVITCHSQLETTILPIGDGLALSYKKAGVK